MLSTCSGPLVTSTKRSRLVAPVGAEIVRLVTVKLLASVALSIVTVLVLALVMRMKVTFVLGRAAADQLVATRQKLLTELVQRLVVLAARAVTQDNKQKSALLSARLRVGRFIRH